MIFNVIHSGYSNSFQMFRLYNKYALKMELKKQITGVEPAFPAWEAGVLPMNHICM